MNLNFDFIISGSLIILALIPLYIYRKKIYNRFYKKGNFNAFIKNIDNYLLENYPKIRFDFYIIKNLEYEKDIRIKETLLVEDIVKQFVYHEYELETQKSISKDKLWSNYEQNSKLQKDNKLPSDWSRRKESAWLREEGRCNRCGTKSKLVDSNALLAKQMKNGGGFNLENIVILCNDCTRVIKSANLEKTRKDLNILDELMKKVVN